MYCRLMKYYLEIFIPVQVTYIVSRIYSEFAEYPMTKLVGNMQENIKIRMEKIYLIMWRQERPVGFQMIMEILYLMLNGRKQTGTLCKRLQDITVQKTWKFVLWAEFRCVNGEMFITLILSSIAE